MGLELHLTTKLGDYDVPPPWVSFIVVFTFNGTDGPVDGKSHFITSHNWIEYNIWFCKWTGHAEKGVYNLETEQSPHLFAFENYSYLISPAQGFIFAFTNLAKMVRRLHQRYHL